MKIEVQINKLTFTAVFLKLLTCFDVYSLIIKIASATLPQEQNHHVEVYNNPNDISNEFNYMNCNSMNLRTSKRGKENCGTFR